MAFHIFILQKSAARAFISRIHRRLQNSKSTRAKDNNVGARSAPTKHFGVNYIHKCSIVHSYLMQLLERIKITVMDSETLRYNLHLLSLLVLYLHSLTGEQKKKDFSFFSVAMDRHARKR